MSENLNEMSPRIQCLTMRLQWYDFELVYTPGKYIVLARAPITCKFSDVSSMEDDVNMHVNLIVESLPVSDQANSWGDRKRSCSPNCNWQSEQRLGQKFLCTILQCEIWTQCGRWHSSETRQNSCSTSVERRDAFQNTWRTSWNREMQKEIQGFSLLAWNNLWH